LASESTKSLHQICNEVKTVLGSYDLQVHCFERSTSAFGNQKDLQEIEGLDQLQEDISSSTVTQVSIWFSAVLVIAAFATVASMYLCFLFDFLKSTLIFLFF
jgi:hypothetical protein